MTVNGNVLYFVNDTVTYNGTTYYYVKNLQGDIVAILDASGNAVVEYTYNAWGVLLSTTGSMASTLGVHNPLRYRGYVYDNETALYYLQSRYYDPDVGRFINADAFASTGQGILGNNMFAYCDNNPVVYHDFDGYQKVNSTKWYNFPRKGYRYRIDDGPNSKHIHIQGPDGKEWKQKSDGSPYEPNHKNTKPGDPPKWLRKLLRQYKDDDDSSNGDGWDWDGNKKNYQDKQNKNNNVKKSIACGVGAVGVGYAVYRIVRIIPSLFPALWWTLPANAACP